MMTFPKSHTGRSGPRLEPGNSAATLAFLQQEDSPERFSNTHQ